MEFLNRVKNSIYSPPFYEKVLKEGIGKAFIYFFLLIILLTVFRTAPIIYSFVKNGQPEIEKMLSSAVDYYPQELEVKIQNGSVTTNVIEPYQIPFPSDSDSEIFDNIIVIDTKTPFSVEQFNKYNTVAWLSKDSIYVKGDGSEFRAYALSDIENLTVNKKSVQELGSKIAPWMKLLTPVIAFFAFAALLFAYVFRLVYIFFLALCIFLLAKVMNKQIPYKQSYKIGMYAITLSLFIEILQHYIVQLQIPFLFTLIALAVFYINFQKIKIASSKKN